MKTSTKRERAIDIIEDARRSHILWGRVQGRLRRAGKAPTAHVGCETFQREWVRKYDLVLEVLRGR